jgi:hypothetical protein
VALFCFGTAGTVEAVPPPRLAGGLDPLRTLPGPVRKQHFAEDVCAIIGREAEYRGLPLQFFARLIWRESLFDPNAVSPVGAEGIAQFMPYTAKLRGLDDPFAPHKALPASAHFLADLKRDFGNLGLAAAGYNAGAGAVSNWLRGKGQLPFETQDYVLFVTGRPADDWTDRTAAHDIPPIGEDRDFQDSCVKLVNRQLNPSPPVERAPRKPWGVVLSGGFSQARALQAFQRIKSRYPSLLGNARPYVARKKNLSMGSRRMVSVMVGTDSRAEADTLCSKLQALGGACMVMKND